MIEQKMIEKTDEKIEKILDGEITSANLDNLYKLTKIRHMAKEDKNMYENYGGYDRDNRYGRYDDYGARRRDSRGRYMGHEHLDRMYDDYGRYMESRDRYGTSEETDKAFHYMLEAVKDFIKVLYQEADTPQRKQMLRQALQNSMM